METVLLFGGTGSLGHAIHQQWASKVTHFVVFGRDESKHWKLKKTFPHLNITCCIGDIMDYDRVFEVMRLYQPQTILVMSAMKHIDYCETNVMRCLQTNVHGLLNVVQAVRNQAADPKTVMFVSTDKACAPVNVYGLSKSISEHIIQQTKAIRNTKFIGVRYGNVLNSSGSVIPIFQEQARNAQATAFTVTHVDMTRFMMSIEESVSLIEDALRCAQAGEIFIPWLPSFRIYDLAQLFAQGSAKPVQVTGIRTGEKIHECMFSADEAPYIATRSIQGRPRFVLSTQRVLELPRRLTLSSDCFLMTPDLLRIRLREYLPVSIKPTVWVLGALGMLGSYVIKYLTRQGFEMFLWTRQEFQIEATDSPLSMATRWNEVTEEFVSVRTAPLVVINCLGLTNKRDASLLDLVNHQWPSILGDWGQRYQVPIIQPSTDCVFSGLQAEPYVESDLCDPVTPYGISKAAGDRHPWLTVIRCSIIGENPRTQEGLIEWFRQVCHDTTTVLPITAYGHHTWNGITCLAWAQMIEGVIYHPFQGLLHIVPPYVVTKAEILYMLRDVYVNWPRTRPLKVQTTGTVQVPSVQRALSTERGYIHVFPPLLEQIQEQSKFMSS